MIAEILITLKLPMHMRQKLIRCAEGRYCTIDELVSHIAEEYLTEQYFPVDERETIYNRSVEKKVPLDIEIIKWLSSQKLRHPLECSHCEPRWDLQSWWHNHCCSADAARDWDFIDYGQSELRERFREAWPEEPEKRFDKALQFLIDSNFLIKF